MKVQVEPKVTAGLDKGGEDLELVFTAYYDGSTPPVGESLEVELATENDYPGCSVVLSDDGSVKYETDYGFVWEGRAEDVQATCEKFLRNPENWRFCHKPGEPERLVCTSKVFVDGNAD